MSETPDSAWVEVFADVVMDAAELRLLRAEITLPKVMSDLLIDAVSFSLTAFDFFSRSLPARSTKDTCAPRSGRGGGIEVDVQRFVKYRDIVLLSGNIITFWTT